MNMESHRLPKDAWGESKGGNGSDRNSQFHGQQPHVTTIVHSPNCLPTGMHMHAPTGSAPQGIYPNLQTSGVNYTTMTGGPVGGNNTGMHGQSVSGGTGRGDTPHHAGSSSTWYDQGQDGHKPKFHVSGLGDMSKLMELCNDKKTFLKLPVEEIHKKIAAIDVRNVHSAISNMEQEILKLRQELDSKTRILEKLEDQFRLSHAELAASNTKVVELQKRIDKQQKKIDKYEKYKQTGAFYEQENMRLTNMITEHQKQLHDAERERKRLDDELKETKLRLSRLIGNKLTDGNAEIADLSDENRPTKIGEKYLELYDNQWTDAFEVLQKYLPDDKSIIASLLDILISVKQHCDGLSTGMTHGLVAALTITEGTGSVKISDATIPAPVNKQLKDLKKMSAGVSVTRVFDLFMDKAKKLWPAPHKLSKALRDPVIKLYIKECTTLCWLMCVQDPPLVLDWDMKQSDSFKPTALKVYLQAGPVLDYLVWPPLYLKAGGSLLAKGIAQGMQLLARHKTTLQPQTSQFTAAKDGNAPRPKTATTAQMMGKPGVQNDQARMKASSRQQTQL